MLKRLALLSLLPLLLTATVMAQSLEVAAPPPPVVKKAIVQIRPIPQWPMMFQAIPVKVREVDGSPVTLAVTELVFPNGSLTRSGSRMTVAISGSGSISGPATVTDNTAACLSVGPNGATNPVFSVVCNVASQATGLSVTGRAAGAGVDLTVLSSGANESVRILSKGAANVLFGGAPLSADTLAEVIIAPSAATRKALVIERFSGQSADVVNVKVGATIRLAIPSTADGINFVAPNALTSILAARVDADTNDRIAIRSGGDLAFGPGNAGGDMRLVRHGVSQFRMRTEADTAGASLLLAGSAGAVGTSGVSVFVIGNGTAPTTSPASETQQYVLASATNDANTYIRNEAGEINRITGLCARVGTQFDATTNTTLANVTGLTRNVEAGRTYKFEANLFVDANVTGGSKYATAGTATATSIKYQIQLFDNSTNAATINSRQTALAGSTGQAGTTAGLALLKGEIVVNAAGTLTIQFAQNAATGTSSVLTDSNFCLTPIN